MAIEIEQCIVELWRLGRDRAKLDKLKSFIEQLFECIDARQQQREEAKRISRAT
jgi:hypothetical protein